MSLTAPIKPTPPTVPQVKLQPVESGSQNTTKPEQPATKKASEHIAEKPAVSAKTEPAANNVAVINKVEPNDQNKLPLLNGAEKSESSNANTVVPDKPPAEGNKLNSIDIYAAVICVILFAGILLFFFWRQKAPNRKIKNYKQQGTAKRQKAGSKAAVPRTVIDYSEDNTKEIIDMLTSEADVQADNSKIKDKIKQEVKSNFEFRV